MQHSKRYWAVKSHTMSWLIILPSVVLFGFFMWAPLLESIRMSFSEVRGAEYVRFLWFDNYISVFNDPDFGFAMRNNLMYAFWSLVLGFVIPIIMAMLIGEAARGRSFLRTAAYFPNIMPGLAAIMLWQFFFTASKNGVLNSIVSAFGGEPKEWLTPELVIPVIIVIMTWKGAGATMLIYMAGLAGINPELYEAATIDGAGVLRRIRHITLPALFNLANTLLILQVIAVFQIMYEPMVLGRGVPEDSISLMQLVWKYAFQSSGFENGKAAAVSVLISVLLIVFTLLYRKLSTRSNDWS
ncbi:MAG: sugar ABC transporter permease [Oscillospiraceae bacterium]|nr:sugar ABC transporter permease [Oscillospiraceae bacterium]